jgi:hypothetical protein
MKHESGLWIDHREAIVVLLSDEGETIKHVPSNMEKRIRYSGASESSGSHDDLAEDIRDRRFDEHLGRYYDDVIATLGDADSVLILGPGEAKIELQKRLESQNPGGRVVKIETSDKLTENQIVASVRQYFKR